MKLTVLGSGTTVPHKERAASAYFLQTDGGLLLLDAGAECAYRMAQENLDWHALDAVWISHFHLDHTGGLAAILFSMKHAPQTKSRGKPLTIFGGRGLKHLLEAFDHAGNYKLFRQAFPVEVREVATHAEFEILHGLRAQTFSTPHTTESLAIRLTDETNASIVYTSDTGYTEALAAFARRTGLLLIECSFPRDKPIDTHLELKEAMNIARLAGARKIILTHIYPEWDNLDIAAEAKRHWPDGDMLGATTACAWRLKQIAGRNNQAV